MKRLILLITTVILLVGCDNSLTAEFATVKEVNENSIVIVNYSGNTTKLEIPHTINYSFEENKDYFFRYEHHRKKTVLISVESIGD